MANEHTEECLKKFSKPQLIAMVLSQRDETKATIQSLRDEVKEMNTNFKKLQADAKTVKKKTLLYGPFLRMGFNCLKARATSRRKFTFNEKVSWYRVTAEQMPSTFPEDVWNCWNTYIYISTEPWWKSLPNIWGYRGIHWQEWYWRLS